MIVVSALTVRLLWIGWSAGTNGETPPFPWTPWQAEQANWTKRCAPIATCGSTARDADRLDPPPPAGPVTSNPIATTTAARTAIGTRRRKNQL